MVDVKQSKQNVSMENWATLNRKILAGQILPHCSRNPDRGIREIQYEEHSKPTEHLINQSDRIVFRQVLKYEVEIEILGAFQIAPTQHHSRCPMRRALDEGRFPSIPELW